MKRLTMSQEEAVFLSSGQHQRPFCTRSTAPAVMCGAMGCWCTRYGHWDTHHLGIKHWMRFGNWMNVESGSPLFCLATVFFTLCLPPHPSGGEDVWEVWPLLPASSSWLPKSNICHHGGLLVRSSAREKTCKSTSLSICFYIYITIMCLSGYATCCLPCNVQEPWPCGQTHCKTYCKRAEWPTNQACYEWRQPLCPTHLLSGSSFGGREGTVPRPADEILLKYSPY